MASIKLICRDPRFPRAYWLLQLEEEGAQLINPEGAVLASFAHANAESRFLFPSFWQSNKNLGIVSDHGDTIWFEPVADNLSDIRRYLGSALADQGTEAIDAMVRKGWLHIVGGVVVMLAGIGLVSFVVMRALQLRRGPWVISIGVLGFGGTLLVRGISFLNRAKLARSDLEQT